MSVVVLGSVTWDVAGYAPRLPAPGETLLGDRYSVGLGGKGANQAVAASRLGAEARFFGRVGRDQFGDAVRHALPEYGVPASDLADGAEATALGVILIGANGENAIIQAPGANRMVEESDVARATSALQTAKVALFQMEVPLESSLAAARVAREAGAWTVLDPAPAPAESLPGSVFMAFDVVTPNEVEAKRYAGFRPTDQDSALAAARRLVELGAPRAVVTMGELGAAYVTESEGEGWVPAMQVESVDTVGAGDVFNGALSVALSEDMPFDVAIEFASRAAAVSTTKPGAAASAPDRAEIERAFGSLTT